MTLMLISWLHHSNCINQEILIQINSNYSNSNRVSILVITKIIVLLYIMS